MASPHPLSKANTTFSLALLKKFGDEDKTANVFFSPFSVSSALAMVMLGTRGDTATQISKVLGFTERQQPQPEQQRQPLTQQLSKQPQLLQKYTPHLRDEDDVHANFADLLSDLNKANAPFALSVANRLYGEQSYQFIEKYLADTRKYYNAELESVDFRSGAEGARININQWVERQTKDKIKNLLPRGVLDSSTRLVLVNAIYFKGNWSKQFKEGFTDEVRFRTNKNDTKLVNMMHQKSDFPFISVPEANCKILEMPYKGKELSMLIFLPNEIEDDTTGLEKLEKELTYEKFSEWTRPDNMSKTEVEVGLPRFKMEKKYDMNDALISMGMRDAFDSTRSNFSGMSSGNDLTLTNVVHKAFVEVNEEGTEAAAATGAVVSLTSVRFPITFIADHPFLFFIRHNPSMSVLFGGRYCSPE